MSRIEIDKRELARKAIPAVVVLSTVGAATYGYYQSSLPTASETQAKEREDAATATAQYWENENKVILSKAKEGEVRALYDVKGGYFVKVSRLGFGDATFLGLYTGEGETRDFYAFLENADCLFNLADRVDALEPKSTGVHKSTQTLDELDVLVHENTIGLPATLGRVTGYRSGLEMGNCPVDRMFNLDSPVLPEWAREAYQDMRNAAVIKLLEMFQQE